ncbi:phosphoribosylformylglycinamidine synthase subunit PurS [Thermaerobacter litoralis]
MSDARKAGGGAARRFFRVVVEVDLRPGALDAQGEAVRAALQGLGYRRVAAVRVGKRVEIDLEASSAAEAEEQARSMAEQLLANPVLEVFRVRVEGEAPAASPSAAAAVVPAEPAPREGGGSPCAWP